MTTTEAIEDTTTGRALLRCKTCKAGGRREYTIITRTFAYLGRPHHTQTGHCDGTPLRFGDRRGLAAALWAPCGGCGSRDVTVALVRGIYIADKNCDGRCMSALGPNCECSCAGDNHGSASHGWA